MYSTVLTAHSLMRWFALLSLLIILIRTYHALITKATYSKFDNQLRICTIILLHTQMILGLILYWISPITNYFILNFGESIHQREIRFFGLEHSSMMFTAIFLITIGSAKSKRKTNPQSKFKTIAIWFTIGLIVILANIPWSFSPLISRPLFRAF